jgi:hypothetical protein
MQQLLASAHGSLFVFVLLQQHFWEVSQQFPECAVIYV